MSGVTGQASHVTYYYFSLKQSSVASRLRVYYQRGLPHLVCKAPRGDNPQVESGATPGFQAPHGDDPQIENLPRLDNLRVQSRTTPRFKGFTSWVHELGPMISGQMRGLKINSVGVRQHAYNIKNYEYCDYKNDPAKRAESVKTLSSVTNNINIRKFLENRHC